MSQEEKDKQVTEFMASVVNRLPYFLHNKILDSFEVKFEFEGKTYQLALLKDGQVNGKDFQPSLN